MELPIETLLNLSEELYDVVVDTNPLSETYHILTGDDGNISLTCSDLEVGGNIQMISLEVDMDTIISDLLECNPHLSLSYEPEFTPQVVQ